MNQNEKGYAWGALAFGFVVLFVWPYLPEEIKKKAAPIIGSVIALAFAALSIWRLPWKIGLGLASALFLSTGVGQYILQEFTRMIVPGSVTLTCAGSDCEK